MTICIRYYKAILQPVRDIAHVYLWVHYWCNPCKIESVVDRRVVRNVVGRQTLHSRWWSLVDCRTRHGSNRALYALPTGLLSTRKIQICAHKVFIKQFDEFSVVVHVNVQSSLTIIVYRRSENSNRTESVPNENSNRTRTDDEQILIEPCCLVWTLTGLLPRIVSSFSCLRTDDLSSPASFRRNLKTHFYNKSYKCSNNGNLMHRWILRMNYMSNNRSAIISNYRACRLSSEAFTAHCKIHKTVSILKLL